MKSKLLRILRSKNNKCPEGELLQKLSCDRSSLLKSVAGLVDHGYAITVESGTVVLESSPDTPFPWEFPEREEKIHHFAVTSSTMEIARELAKKGCPNLTVVMADRQTKGRGRLDRRWISQEGGLYFTIVVRTGLAPSEGFRFTFLASLVLAELLRRACSIEAWVKWPNDIVTERGKLAGILSEMHTTAGSVDFLNIGIGVNVNNEPDRFEPGAVSLRSLTGRNFSRIVILREFLDGFETGLKGIEDFGPIISRWKTLSRTINRQVRVATTGETIEGFALDVDEEGSLVVSLPDGTIRKIRHGDCFHN